jgi:segregation and condensation protein A
MAAWLTYLKSRLLLPQRERPAPEEPPAEETARGLAFRLAKLDAVRRAAEALAARPQLGREVFTRGDPEAVRVTPSQSLEGDLYGLMRAYAEQRRSQSVRHYQPAAPQAYPLEDARARLRGMMPQLKAWRSLAAVAPWAKTGNGPSRASYLASTLSASLELVKEGALEARQAEAFAELYLRSRLRLEADL